MQTKTFKVNILDIVPQQHFLAQYKIDSISDYFKNTDDYGIIYVIEYKNKIYLIDGHHRLYYLYKKGVEEITVVNEIDDNDSTLYQTLADEADQLGLKTIADLESRILSSQKEFEQHWIDKCQLLLLEEEEVESYINHPCRVSALPLYKEIRRSSKGIEVIHNDDFDRSQKDKSTFYQRYFRLSHSLENVQYTKVEGYTTRVVDIKKDKEKIQNIINGSYEDISISMDEIIRMTTDRVFEPSLWVFIVDEKTHQEIGLGICQYDRVVGEVDFDWIQILPNYQGLGLGTMLTTYLLSNCPEDAKFATVSGDIDNPSSPEKLYRKCGFTGNDIWHIIK